jgi:thioredoxin 1
MKFAEGVPMVIEITDLDFEQKVVKSKQTALIDMWRPGCVPCRVIEPIVNKLSEKYGAQCKFYRMNVTENPRTAAKYRVMSLPTLMFFKNGEAFSTHVGAIQERALAPKIEEIL